MGDFLLLGDVTVGIQLLYIKVYFILYIESVKNLIEGTSSYGDTSSGDLGGDSLNLQFGHGTGSEGNIYPMGHR